MMRLAIIIVVLTATLGATAQQKADIVVSYEQEYPSWLGSKIKQKMSLLANSSLSKYFNEISQWSDSLSSTPEGKAKLDEIIKANCFVKHPDGYDYWDLTKGPVKNIYTYVINNPIDNSLTHYDEYGDEPGFYKEDLSEQCWVIISDSTETILGYECVLAQSDYHGRKWKAWFTPEIPLPYGPWKLHGLPGLILKASGDGKFLFKATGIEKSERIITPIYSPGSYGSVDRKKALADNEHYINNQAAIMSANIGGKVKITYADDNGNSVEQPSYDGLKHCIEPDYKME